MNEIELKNKCSFILQYKHLLILFIFLIPLFSAINAMLAVIYVYILVLFLALKSNAFTFTFFILFCFIQNITLLTFADRFNETTTTLFSISKEVMIYGVVFSRLLTSRRLRMPIEIIIFIVLLVMSFIFSNAPLFSKILTIRQLLLPFICVYFGYFLIISKNDLTKDIKLIIYLSIIVSIIGLLEILIYKDSFWYVFSQIKYQQNKGTEFVFYNNVPLNYYTWDFVNFTGSVHRRLVSLFVDPLMTAHYLFLGFCLLDLVKIKHKNICKLLLFICSILTLCKGVFICYLIYFFVKSLRNIDPYKIKKYFLISAIVFILIMCSVYYLAQRYMPNSSIIIHFNGLIGGIFSSGFFGRGIGKAGVITGMVGGQDISLASESFVGVLTYQLGYVGLFVYLSFMLRIMWKFILDFQKNKRGTSLISVILGLSVLVESFLSESSIGIIATGLYFVFIGISYKRIEVFEFENSSSNCNV